MRAGLMAAVPVCLCSCCSGGSVDSGAFFMLWWRSVEVKVVVAFLST